MGCAAGAMSRCRQLPWGNKKAASSGFFVCRITLEALHRLNEPDFLHAGVLGGGQHIGQHFVTRLAIGFQFKRRSEEHTSELQSLMRTSYAVFCLKKKKTS